MASLASGVLPCPALGRVHKQTVYAYTYVQHALSHAVGSIWGQQMRTAMEYRRLPRERGHDMGGVQKCTGTYASRDIGCSILAGHYLTRLIPLTQMRHSIVYAVALS